MKIHLEDNQVILDASRSPLSEKHKLAVEIENTQLQLAEDRRQNLSEIRALTTEIGQRLAQARRSLVERLGRAARGVINAVTRLSWRSAAGRSNGKESEYLFWINFVYATCLGRRPDPGGHEAYMARLKNGLLFSQFIQEVGNSPEAKQRGVGSVWSGNLSDSDLSDGEFILNVAEVLFHGTGATPRDIEFWRGILKEDPAKRSEVIQNLIAAHVVRQQEGEAWLVPLNCWIMGTDRFLTPAVWQERAKKLKSTRAQPQRPRPALSTRIFKHSGDYVVSAIASLYRGRRHLESFLENITAQTIFDRSELIIIDADSPEGEAEVIAEYQKIYPNIVYKRINYRVGIYDAWNVGVQMARGRYLTITNFDDLRRCDSFELQANALDQRGSVDVVYQDFFYSFDCSLGFEAVAKFGFKSELPILTPHNLLVFNSPHNAPMWRTTLHEALGLFDTSYRSAGDWEFWLRCLSRGRQFFKINTPHVVYFQNPEGISTQPDSRGVEEGRRVLKLYARKLISPRLLMSRQAFAELTGGPHDMDRWPPYYDIVQMQLKLLGDQYKSPQMANLSTDLQS
jgi:hypothetical protein